MTYWFLVLLAGLWITLYLPSIVRVRRQAPLPAAKRFKQAMRTIAPPKEARRPARPTSSAPSGRYVLIPNAAQARARLAAERSLRRRRILLAALIAAAVATGALALIEGGDLTEIHLLADGVLLFYVAILFETKRRADERAEKVRPLRSGRRVPAGERRLAAGGARPR